VGILLIGQAYKWKLKLMLKSKAKAFERESPTQLNCQLTAVATWADQLIHFVIDICTHCL